MTGELHDHAEMQTITGRNAESARLVVSMSDMATFQAVRVGSSTAVADREQQLFGNGFSFDQVTSPYGRNDVIAQVHYLDDQPMHQYWTKNEPSPRGTKPFVDTGKTVDPQDPDTWTLPKPENYKGWMPGDPINPLMWAEDSSKYVQEIMRENFVIGPDGKRVSIAQVNDSDFRKRFGNAVRHSIGIGDLVLMEGYDPRVAESGMFLHEPQSWLSGAVESAVKFSKEPWNHNITDSQVDIANNAYAAKEAGHVQTFDSFARKMLAAAWSAAMKGTGEAGVPLGTK